ncbi:phosphoserine phosphatase [Spirochaetia bacterium]|nr:phosphoserine phosphatase [Spirochaetia bacterium]
MSTHLFDVDHTLVRSSTGYFFLRECLKQRVFSLRQLRGLPLEWFRYKIGHANQDFISEAVSRLGGIDRRVMDSLVSAYFTHRLKPNIYAEGERLIRELREKGESVHLATSSFDVLIRPLEDYFSLADSIDSVLEFIEDKTTGRIRGLVPFGKNKKNAVEAWLNGRSLPPEDVYFYSDSYTDLPVLEFCGHPVAVNPDRFLEREAKQRGWQVLRFRETLG